MKRPTDGPGVVTADDTHRHPGASLRRRGAHARTEGRSRGGRGPGFYTAHSRSEMPFDVLSSACL